MRRLLRRRTLAGLALPLFACGCGPAPGADEAATISYSRDVAPLFETDRWYGPTFGGRCASCHHEGSITGLDLTRPFDATVGLVNVPSDWTGDSGGMRVARGDAARSFLLDKIARTDLDRATEGWQMPSPIPRLGASEVDDVRAWIAGGANDDDFFAERVAPLFGDAQSKETAGRCSVCHYPGSPTGLDLTRPFDPEHGLVNVPADRGAAGAVRVVPGDPERSFLMDKLERTDLDATIEGQPMPLHPPRLESTEVDVIRIWIEEGARAD